MRRLAVYRHVPFEDLGLIAASLEAHDITYEYIDTAGWRGADLGVEDIDGLVLMGGPMSANDGFAYLQEEMRQVRRVHAAGKPVLGICLGAQLIAKALGGQVRGNPEKEIGWFPVTWTERAASDTLFGGFEDPETVFHWHGETFELPPGAEWLASSERCRNQAFRVGTCTYGLQFHLEVTPEMIAAWCLEDANCGDVRELGAPIDPHLNADRLRQIATTVFDRWAEQVVRCAG